jgi:hypothetical protein
LTRTRIEAQNYKLDFELKTDEVNRLQKVINDLNELREQFYATEQKLNMQTKMNQSMQDKLAQLQNELVARGFEANVVEKPHSNHNDISNDNIIDNLKLIIQEQLFLKNASSRNDIEDLKFKVF